MHIFYKERFIIKNMIINEKKDIYINIALLINKLMLDDSLITYNLYKITEDAILKKGKSSIQ